MILVQNKKIGLEYSIEKKEVFGVELLGSEVKSLRTKAGSLEGARVVVVNGEVFLVGAYIPLYQEKNNAGLDAYRTRKLLANREEILQIKNLQHGQNLHIFPISFFLKGRLIKLECGIGKRLKKQDKREVIRKKDEKRKGVE
jgi:SsrA-binding protein